MFTLGLVCATIHTMNGGQLEPVTTGVVDNLWTPPQLVAVCPLCGQQGHFDIPSLVDSGHPLVRVRCLRCDHTFLIGAPPELYTEQ